MRVVCGFPPNITEIRARLRPGPNTVYTYGDVVYVPTGHLSLPPDLQAHEGTHVGQQERVGGPENWWRRYLTDPQFRLGQEVEAYRNQYRVARLTLPRPERRRLLARISRDLAGPMYGGLIGRARARELIVGSTPDG